MVCGWLLRNLRGRNPQNRGSVMPTLEGIKMGRTLSFKLNPLSRLSLETRPQLRLEIIFLEITIIMIQGNFVKPVNHNLKFWVRII